MEHVRVTQELDVAWCEDHVERVCFAHCFQHLHCVLLLHRQRWNARVGPAVESSQRGDIVGVEPRVDAGLLPVGPVFQVDHTTADPGLLASGDFSLAVKVPVWGGEGFDDVWVRALQDVEDVVRGDDVGFAAGLGFRDAEEADEVGAVCVEVLSFPSWY